MQYKVIITAVSFKKEEVKQLLMSELHCSEKEAFKYVSVSPIEVADYSNYEEAKQLRNKLQELGVDVKIVDETITKVNTQSHQNISSQSNAGVVNISDSTDNNPSSIGLILKYIGAFTYAIGMLGALIGFSSMGIMSGILIIVASVISGSIIFGLGEIVVTLQAINRKLK